MDSYPAIYTDKTGSVETIFNNDGETLMLKIRGTQFAGIDFDQLEPAEHVPIDEIANFSLNRNQLCSCRIECKIPILIQDRCMQNRGELFVRLILGDPLPNGWLDREELHITLECSHGKFSSAGDSGCFEDELLDIQSQLPPDVYMKACINCLYSDYSPYGHGAFGCLMCYRNVKAEYLKVKSKADFWPVLDRYDRYVQETYLCPEFERRVPGTGYRG